MLANHSGSASAELARPPHTRSFTLSLLMAAYNEQATIARAVADVCSTPFPCGFELIVVDDGSDDATWSILEGCTDPRVRTYRHSGNLGKGAAIQTAAALAVGTHLIPFDADLEYAAVDVIRMLEPVLAGRCDVVFGARRLDKKAGFQAPGFVLGNRFLTAAANLVFHSGVSDLHTCLKLMPRALLIHLDARESGFGLDTELAAKLLRGGIYPFEVPVSYRGRSYAEGKKITWRHGLECLRIIGRVRFGTQSTREVVPVKRRGRAVISVPVCPHSFGADRRDRVAVDDR